jgi:hypothetical protein
MPRNRPKALEPAMHAEYFIPTGLRLRARKTDMDSLSIMYKRESRFHGDMNIFASKQLY